MSNNINGPDRKTTVTTSAASGTITTTTPTTTTTNQTNEQSAYAGNVGATGLVSIGRSFVNGGRFDFDDGGSYCGGWEDGKAHGHGVCTGPKGQGIYAGSWHYGFEVFGSYKWPSGSGYEGQWQNGKRHGLGIEGRGRWLYRGEWTQGFKGRYGVRQSIASAARYEGTWANGLQDGYGSETYADGGIYQGQWLRGMRHGYGVRTSAPFGQASRHRAVQNASATLAAKQKRDSISSLQSAELEVNERRDRKVDDLRGGFVLKAVSDEVPVRRRSLTEKPSQIKRSLFAGLKIRKQKSTGDLEKRGMGSVRSNSSTASWMSTDSNQSINNAVNTTDDSNASFLVEDEQLDPNVTETYFGEWKNDKRCGFGVSERSDGLRYEGEWFANKKYGYGITTFRDGSRDEGKYKNNVLITSQKKKNLFLIRSTKFREKIDAAVNAAQRASKIALQKADIAISRTATARGKAEQADLSAENAREDCDIAVTTAKKISPDFEIPFLDKPNMRSVIKTITAAALVSSQSQPHVLTNPNSFPLKSVLKKTTNYPSSMSELRSDRMVSNSQSKLTTRSVDEESRSLTIETLQSIPDKVPVQKLSSASSEMSSFKNDGTYSEKSDEQPIPAEDSSRVRKMSPMPDDQHQATTARRHPKLGQMAREPSIDHFDHYKRAPSRDRSLDRYSRATSRLSTFSRGPSIERSSTVLNHLSGSQAQLPLTSSSSLPFTSLSPSSSLSSSSHHHPHLPPTVTSRVQQSQQNFASIPIIGSSLSSSSSVTAPFEDVIMRNRTLGQDIIPSPGQPKRTESLFIKTSTINDSSNATSSSSSSQTTTGLQSVAFLQRKKSLPDVQSLPQAVNLMSREEVSHLSSARREEVRRQLEERERIRANPFLFFVSPQFKYIMEDHYDWRTFTDVDIEVTNFGRGIRELGQQPKHNIVIFAETKAQWMIAAHALFRQNIPVVTLYATLGEDAIAHGINETEVTMVITTQELLPKFTKILPNTPKVNCIIYMDDHRRSSTEKKPKTNNVIDERVKLHAFSEVQKLGKNSSIQDASPKPQDIAIIMYTSGSTGNPKGVVITHENLMATMKGFSDAVVVDENDVLLGFLPLAHVFELLAENICLLTGISIGYSSPLTLIDSSSGLKKGARGDASVLRPTALTTVPLILDRISKGVQEKVSKGGVVAKSVFSFAYRYKKRWMKRGYDTPILNRLLFSKITNLLGGRVHMLLCGGAPLSPETHEFIKICLCTSVIQGYGLTETTSCATIMDNFDRTLGRAGAPASVCDIRLIDWNEGKYRVTDKPFPRGEIVIGGSNISSGYYKLPDKTSEDFFDEDGVRWFRTGDIGEFHEDGVLKIIDRKKDLVKLQAGEYVSLGKVEAELKTCPIIENICVYGDSSKQYTVALIVPHQQNLFAMAQRHGYGEKPFEELCSNRKFEKIVLAEMTEHAKKCKLQKFEIPGAVTLCKEVWTPDMGLVTAAFKLKRKDIQLFYQEDINRMYA